MSGIYSTLQAMNTSQNLSWNLLLLMQNYGTKKHNKYITGLCIYFAFVINYFFRVLLSNACLLCQIHYYVQSHIQTNEYRDRVILVSISIVESQFSNAYISLTLSVRLTLCFMKQPSATKKYGRYIGTCIKILDMTGLKLSALNQIKVSLHIACPLPDFIWLITS